MATLQKRIREFLRSSFTVTGSVSFRGRTDITTAAIFAGPMTVNAVMTVNTIATFKASSDVAQFAGKTTVGCGAATFTASTTAVKSNSLIFYSLDSRGQGNLAASTSLGFFTTRTIADSLWFTAGWSTGNNAIPNNQVDVSWFIINQG